jgi:prolipoprotein diacylglyceryltransferase
VRAKGASLPAMADAVAPALPLAQAIGRWGNYFNQELFGRPTDLPFALGVEDEIARRAGEPAGTTFHPTFLYESLWNAALVGVILWVDRRGVLRRRGDQTFVLANPACVQR